jgi:ribosomal protein S24E
MPEPPKAMDIKVVRDEQNKLLNRREVVFEIRHSGAATPSRKDIAAQLAAKLTADDKMIVVRPLDSEYGTPVIKGVANIYKNEKDMKVETAYILKRNMKEEPKAEQPAEAPKEVPKTEEKKEAPKSKEKKEGA